MVSEVVAPEDIASMNRYVDMLHDRGWHPTNPQFQARWRSSPGGCGATHAGLDHAPVRGLDDDPRLRSWSAAAVGAEQVDGLVDRGLRHFHFYTLNRADLTYAICRVLGVRETQPNPRRPWHDPAGTHRRAEARPPSAS